MERRFELLKKHEVRNIDSYNGLVKESPEPLEPLPKIVVCIDELCDLMLVAKKPIEDLIMSLAQKARAVGIHLIIATQRPTVDVLTGVIKANIPSRIALKTASYADSKTVLDAKGAEKLLMHGDMLYLPVGAPAPVRIQGAFTSDNDMRSVLEYVKNTYPASYDSSIINEVREFSEKINVCPHSEDEFPESEEHIFKDKKFLKAFYACLDMGKASTSLIQRKVSIGYGKASRFIEILEDMGLISEPNGQKPRDVLITKEEFDNLLKNEGIDPLLVLSDSKEIKDNEAQAPLQIGRMLFEPVTDTSKLSGDELIFEWEEKAPEETKQCDEEAQHIKKNSGLNEVSLFISAIKLAIDCGALSTVILQRKFSIGYGRAARIIDTMQDLGFISDTKEGTSYKVLLTKDEWQGILERINK
jgi:DNA segregation ATPase FtsK/SpoIIIE-like protein